MLQHGKSVVHSLKMNLLISAVSGCRSLSSFSQNYVKVCDYKKSVFQRRLRLKREAWARFPCRWTCTSFIIIRTVFLIIIIIILSGGLVQSSWITIIIITVVVAIIIIIISLTGGLVHTPGNWRAQSHLER